LGERIREPLIGIVYADVDAPIDKSIVQRKYCAGP
jgi:hypothetical protein